MFRGFDKILPLLRTQVLFLTCLFLYGAPVLADPQSDLLKAIKQGHVDRVESILSSQIGQLDFKKANEDTERKDTLLTYAARFGNAEIVGKLIKHSQLAPDLQHKAGNVTPLSIAAQEGHVAAVEKLLENNSDPNAIDEEGMTPLYMPCQRGHNRVVELLLDYGGDPNWVANKNNTLLMAAAAGSDNEGVARTLLNFGADPNLPRWDGSTPLFLAAQNGFLGVVRTLLEFGADPNIARPDGCTSLVIASQFGRSAVVQALLEQGADPNKTTRNSALLSSLLNKRPDITKVLLDCDRLDLAHERSLAEGLLSAFVVAEIDQAIQDKAKRMAAQEAARDALVEEISSQKGEESGKLTALLKREKELEKGIQDPFQLASFQLAVAEALISIRGKVYGKLYRDAAIDLFETIAECKFKGLSNRAVQILYEMANQEFCHFGSNEDEAAKEARHSLVLRLAKRNPALFDRVAKNFVNTTLSPNHVLSDCPIALDVPTFMKMLKRIKALDPSIPTQAVSDVQVKKHSKESRSSSTSNGEADSRSAGDARK